MKRWGNRWRGWIGKMGAVLKEGEDINIYISSLYMCLFLIFFNYYFYNHDSFGAR